MATSYFDGIEWIQHKMQMQWVGWSAMAYHYYVLHYVHRGQLTLAWNDGPKVNFRGPLAWVVQPGMQLYVSTLDDTGMDYGYISFAGPRAEQFRKRSLFRATPEYRAVTVNEPTRFYQQLARLIRILTLNELPPEHAVHLLEGLLLQLHEPGSERNASRMAQVRELAQMIRDRPKHGWDFDAEADRIHLSVPQFRRLFRTATSKPPNQFLLDACMSRASALLHDPAMNVTQVGEQLGFADPAYFSRCFKQWAGMSPRAYRRSIGHDVTRD